jgi:hypothetical protein
MFDVLQVLTVILVVLAMAPALAHALELPGKMRLTKDAYLAMQPIYYPGFTIAGGLGEAGGMISTSILLALTPLGSADFWLTLVALLGLIGMQAVYWLFTHPVNKFWLQGEKLSGFSERSTSPLTVHPAAPSILLVLVRDRHAAISPCRLPDYRKRHSEMPVNS